MGCSGEATHEQASLAIFTQDLLEVVMLRTATTKIRAGYQMGKYTVQIGKRTFRGDKSEVFEKVLAYLVRPDEELPENLEEEANLMDRHKQVEDQLVLEALIGEGMTPEGRALQDEREHRLTMIQAVVEPARMQGMSVDEILEELRKKGLGEVTRGDVFQALRRVQ